MSSMAEAVYWGVAIGVGLGCVLALTMYCAEHVGSFRKYVRDRRIQQTISTHFPATSGDLTHDQKDIVLRTLAIFGEKYSVIADLINQVKKGELSPTYLKRINSVMCFRSTAILYYDVWKWPRKALELQANTNNNMEEINKIAIEGIQFLLTEEKDFLDTFSNYAGQVSGGEHSVWLKLGGGILSIRVANKQGKTLACINYIIDYKEEFDMVNEELLEKAREHIKLLENMGVLSLLRQED